MAPSDLETLVEAARRVNASFFKVARKAGLNKVVEQVLETFKNDFLLLFASRSNADTAG
jgi:hypothetical protein